MSLLAQVEIGLPKRSYVTEEGFKVLLENLPMLETIRQKDILFP